MKNQRDQAYKTYMSDTAVLISSLLAGRELDLPRYADIITPSDVAAEEEDINEQSRKIMGKFDKLRRNAG